MYAQREKPKEKKKQVTVVVNQTKTSPRLGEDCLAHRPNGLGQRHDKAQIRNAAARYCQPSPSTIQRMDDDKDKDKEQSSENLDNLQLSLELLGMTPGVGMIADAANVGISLFRGNYADALINLAAMVPIVGQGVTGGKLAAKAASSATDVLGATKAKVNGYVVDNANTAVSSGLKDTAESVATIRVENVVPNTKALSTAEIHGIPEGSAFKDWFDSKSVEDIAQLYKDANTRDVLKSRLRHGGGDHEWLMVSRAAQVKSWGVSYDEIIRLVTPTKETFFRDPVKGVIKKHGTNSISSRAHKQLGDLIDSSNSFDQFKRKLNNWAEYSGWLPGGRSDLPVGLKIGD